jgi:hypothetical protein
MKNEELKTLYCDKCGGIIARSWATSMMAGGSGRCECGVKKIPTQIKEWRMDIKERERTVKKMNEALEFPNGSKINGLDLLRVLRNIKALPEGHMFPMIAIEHSFKYSHDDFLEIIDRLIKLGELFHPEMGPKAKDEEWIQKYEY